MFKILLSILPLFYTVNSFAHGISEEAKQAMINGGLKLYRSWC